MIDEPMQLALGEESVDEVETAEVPDVHRAKIERLDHPLVLRVAIAVLVRTESVGDTLVGVDDGARKVIRRIYFPF